MIRWATLLCVSVVTLSGCAAIEDYHYAYANHRRAELAWKHNSALFERTTTSSHYTHGWKQGYFEVCTGGSGEPPAVPPSKYWSPRYQGETGQLAIEDWYAGYQDGATTAHSTGVGEWHPIYTGPTVPVGPVSWPTTEIFPSELPAEEAIPSEPLKSAAMVNPPQRLAPAVQDPQPAIEPQSTAVVAPHELNVSPALDGSRRLPPPGEDASDISVPEAPIATKPSDTNRSVAPATPSSDEANIAPPVFTDE